MILLLFDAMREDFIQFDKDSQKHTRISKDHPDHYRGRKLELFKRLKEEQPDRTFLLPMTSALPTITTVRVKSVLTGGVSSFYDTIYEFVSKEVQEDNVLHQLKSVDSSFKIRF